ncbi:hypothetical protein Tco_0138788 [Tanacetum coccineum]
MSSASYAVTYTFVYTDSEPRRVFWGADEEVSDGGSPRVIVLGYGGLPIQPGIEPVIPPPSTDITTTGARITVRLQASISLPPKAEVERLLAMPTPPPSPPISLSPPSAGERLARDTWMDPAEAVPEIAPVTLGEISQDDPGTSDTTTAAGYSYSDTAPGNVKSARPKTLDETIELANDLMNRNSSPMRKGKLTTKGRLTIHPETTMVTNNNPSRVGKISPRSSGKQSTYWLISNGQWTNPKEMDVLNVELQDFQERLSKVKNKDGKWEFTRRVYAVGNSREERECIDGTGLKSSTRRERISTNQLTSCSKAQEYMAKGCQVFLAQISAKKEEDKSEGKQLKNVPIIRDFSKVFPEDLPGLPPVRPVEFQIDLIPGAAPVARALYRLTPSYDEGIVGTTARAFRQRLHKTQFLTLGSPGLVCQKEGWVIQDVHRLPQAKTFVVIVMLHTSVLEAQIEALKPKNLENEDVDGALYSRKCRSPVYWAKVGEAQLTGPEMKFHERQQRKIVLIKQRLQLLRKHKKSYADLKRKPMEFEVEDRVMLKVFTLERVVRFGKDGVSLNTELC